MSDDGDACHFIPPLFVFLPLFPSHSISFSPSRSFTGNLPNSLPSLLPSSLTIIYPAHTYIHLLEENAHASVSKEKNFNYRSYFVVYGGSRQLQVATQAWDNVGAVRPPRFLRLARTARSVFSSPTSRSWS